MDTRFLGQQHERAVGQLGRLGGHTLVGARSSLLQHVGGQPCDRIVGQREHVEASQRWRLLGLRGA